MNDIEETLGGATTGPSPSDNAVPQPPMQPNRADRRRMLGIKEFKQQQAAIRRMKKEDRRARI